MPSKADTITKDYVNSGLKYDEEDEMVNVCQIQEMRKESEGYAVETVKGSVTACGDPRFFVD